LRPRRRGDSKRGNHRDAVEKMLYIHGVRSQFVDQFGKDAGRNNGRELNRTLLNLGKYASISVNVPIESPRQLFS
jgi:hypothetical protein